MSPLPPPDKWSLPGKAQSHRPRSKTGVATHFEYTSEHRARDLAARKKIQDFRKNSPIFAYRRRLWDLQMAEVGLTPEGRELGGVRAQMIQRMNQLRGGM